MKISDSEIKDSYEELKEYYETYLAKFGVKLPILKRNKVFTEDALVLVYLYKHFQKPVTKEELTDFLAHYRDRSNDVQQARHLGQQKGWYIISGQRKDNQCKIYGVTPGKYSLISLKEPYPGFTRLRRGFDINEESGNQLKKIINIDVQLVVLLKMSLIYNILMF
ncbi:MAG: hypothetical protein LBD03_09535 [Methanobrevibacter sp.]|jgi:hypothetical protein|nr:hypothetical protein [Candidatus Methanovirga procula]